MTAAVLQLPGAFTAQVERGSLNLTEAEIVEITGGYVRPADQLKALHARGFVRAWRHSDGRGPVILERSHYDAVTRGQFGAPATTEPVARQPIAPDRAAFRRKYGKKE